jgi:hypothetical protein
VSGRPHTASAPTATHAHAAVPSLPLPAGCACCHCGHQLEVSGQWSNVVSFSSLSPEVWSVGEVAGAPLGPGQQVSTDPVCRQISDPAALRRCLPCNATRPCRYRSEFETAGGAILEVRGHHFSLPLGGPFTGTALDQLNTYIKVRGWDG